MEPSSPTQHSEGRYGPWAVVTGASDGIGRACAYQIAERSQGQGLVLVARRERALVQLANELEAKFGTRCRVLASDLSRPEHVSALIDACRDLDVGLLIAAAGFGTSGAFLDGEIGQELGMLDVNCRAVTQLVHAFGRGMAARKRGGIVLFSSLVAFQGVPNAAHYAATKAYIQTLAEGLHVELGRHGVDVIASAPGPVHSGFAGRANMTMGRAATPEMVAAKTLAALGRTMTVRPGMLSKLLEAALTLPRWGRVRIMEKVMGGMANHAPALNAAAGDARNLDVR
ncbi:MAG: SDR family NAD(P)-dependent oxidoreductase [Myxococcota bacterium]